MTWTNDLEVMGVINSLYKQKCSWKAIFKELRENYSYDFVSPEAIRKGFKSNEFKLEDFSEPSSDITYEEAYRRLSLYVEKKNHRNSPKERKSKEKKILVLSDPHCPFHNTELISQIVNEHKDADICIVPGDILDCYSVSRFSKKIDMPLKQEIAEGMAFIEKLAATFPKVILLEGNHTERVRKYFESRVEPQVMFLVNHDLLKIVCSNHSNIQIVKDHYVFGNGNGEGVISYFTLIGKDFVVGHWEKANKPPVKAAMDAYLWLESWKRYFNIPHISLFLQAHTHRLSKYPIGDGSTVIGESGCVAKIQSYAIESGAKYSAHLTGYWLVYQNDGITDINKSNFFIV